MLSAEQGSISSRPSVFKKRTQKDAEIALDVELKKLLANVPDPLKSKIRSEFDGFKELFRRYLDNSSQQIDWSKIVALDQSRFLNLAVIAKPPQEDRKNLLDKLVVVKLNGGLGTSMGCVGTKSLISVRSDLTFLDLTVQQIEYLNNKYNCSVPLVLMNSFNTQEDTERVLRKYQQVNVKIYTFEQSRFPRLNRESLLPVATTAHPWTACPEGWYPPGHGDIYRSFVKAGFAKKFLAEGKKWLFIANIDNMGATVNLSILHYLENSSSEFIMELTEKTRADVKGGTLVEYEDKLRLLEIAQVPKERVDEFTSVHKFHIFNTNNLWVSLKTLNQVVAENRLTMEIIVNPKTLDCGMNVLQLEEAAGAAIKNFQGAFGMIVPRSRFLPVKTTSDLLLLMSNLYTMKSGTIMFNKERDFPSTPLVKLGTHFKKVKDFLARFDTIPSMLELDHLTVSGDVTFGKAVQLRGTVIIIANHGERIDIPSGAILENKIVSGNLRILDH